MKIMSMRTLSHVCLLLGLCFSTALAQDAPPPQNKMPDLVGKWLADIGEERPCVFEFRADNTVRLLSRGITGEGKYRVDASSAPIKMDLYDMKMTNKGLEQDRDMLAKFIVAIVVFPEPNRMRFCSADVKGKEKPESVRPTDFEGDVLDFVREGSPAALAPANNNPPATKGTPSQAVPQAALLHSSISTLFRGIWKIEFVFQRNTRNPDQTMHSWEVFDCMFIQRGNSIMGNLKGANPGTTGTVTGTLTDAGLVGTMQMSHDDHNWQIFALRPISTNLAEGVAIFAPHPQKDDEREIYWLKAIKK